MIKNINVGVLGHVDAGKTALCKALSSISSTAAFDKNPQSQERGISLDLGFSALKIIPELDLRTSLKCDELQFTFVDCPGHASLIRTVIGGAHIINFMLLVIDVQKGLQAQTVECLVIARITCPRMIIVLNKVDKLDPNKMDIIIEKMSEKFRRTFSGQGIEIVDIVPVAATANINLKLLEAAMIKAIRIEDGEQDESRPFLFAIDHCFTIRGKGTICTGTVLQGQVRVHDEVDIPQLCCKRTIKSIEMFRVPLPRATRGDRLGLCITQFDSKQMERGLICSPGSVPYCHCAIVDFNKVDLYRGEIRSKMKFHVHVGHATTLATISLVKKSTEGNEGDTAFSLIDQYQYAAEVVQGDSQKYFVILEFEKPVLWIPNSLLIASKLDMDGDHGCRLAFHGRILAGCSQANYKDVFLSQIKIFKTKSKVGSIQRVVNENELIVEDFFSKNSHREIFVGLKVILSSGQTGRIESTFGKAAKVKILLDSPLREEDMINYKGITISLHFKKLLFSDNKKIFQ